jgi:hypothetical protein
MLSELTLLLHEMSVSLRGRVRPRAGERGAPLGIDLANTGAITGFVYVTGLASSGKRRLVSALKERLSPAHLDVHPISGPAPPPTDRTLHVHAETDLEALVEGGLQSVARDTARGAELVVPVDWEPVDRSVGRVIEALIGRGFVPALSERDELLKASRHCESMGPPFSGA